MKGERMLMSSRVRGGGAFCGAIQRRPERRSLWQTPDSRMKRAPLLIASVDVVMHTYMSICHPKFPNHAYSHLSFIISSPNPHQSAQTTPVIGDRRSESTHVVVNRVWVTSGDSEDDLRCG